MRSSVSLRSILRALPTLQAKRKMDAGRSVTILLRDVILVELLVSGCVCLGVDTWIH